MQPTSIDWDKIDRSGLHVAATFGRFVLKPLYNYSTSSGQLKVEGVENLIDSIKSGPTIVPINHPTIIDTFFPEMALKDYWSSDSRFFLWNMPDDNFFERFLNLPFPWIPRVLRSVTVDRHKDRNARDHKRAALEFIVELLNHGYSIIWHVEGGRTCTGTSWEEIEYLGQHRKIRKHISSQVAKVAARVPGCRIQPAYLHNPWADEPLGFGTCVRRLVDKRYDAVTLYMRNPSYTIQQPFNFPEEQRRIKQGVLTS